MAYNFAFFCYIQKNLKTLAKHIGAEVANNFNNCTTHIIIKTGKCIYCIANHNTKIAYE